MDWNPCSCCGGSGTITCPSCNGTGKQWAGWGKETTCDECGGSGEVTCSACNGSGEED